VRGKICKLECRYAPLASAHKSGTVWLFCGRGGPTEYGGRNGCPSLGHRNASEQLTQPLFEEGAPTPYIGRRWPLTKEATIGKLHRHCAWLRRHQATPVAPPPSATFSEIQSGPSLSLWPSGQPQPRELSISSAVPARFRGSPCAPITRAIAYCRPQGGEGEGRPEPSRQLACVPSWIARGGPRLREVPKLRCLPTAQIARSMPSRVTGNIGLRRFADHPDAVGAASQYFFSAPVF